MSEDFPGNLIRGCFVGVGEIEPLLREMLESRLPSRVSLDSYKKEEFPRDRELLNLLKRNYDFIVLPLTLPRYNLLRLVELANLLDLPTRLVLLSKTDADRVALSRVYDACWLPFIDPKLLADDLLLESKRERQPHRVQDAFARILKTASCFRMDKDHHGGGRPASLSDYRSSLLPEGELEYDVFISHVGADSELAEELRAEFERNGMRCFMALMDIEAGLDWEQEIRKALIASRRILLLLTQRSVNRPWVLFEAGAGWALNKEVIPALNQVSPSDLIEPIARFQAVKVETTRQKQSLAKKLSGMSGSNSTET